MFIIKVAIFLAASVCLIMGDQKTLLRTPRVLSNSPCTGCTSTCIIISPSDNSDVPCYQGPPQAISRYYYNCPLVPSNAKWECGLCADNGYPYYYQDDPVFKDVQWWTQEPVPTK